MDFGRILWGLGGAVVGAALIVGGIAVAGSATGILSDETGLKAPKLW